MGITTSGFQLAMEIYGAKRLKDQEGAKYEYICVPCFEVKGVKFLHSGTNYVVTKNKLLSLEYIKKVLLEKVGQKEMQGQHFQYDKICSIKGLITLAALIDDKYSREYVDNILSEIYQRLIQDTSNLFEVSKDKYWNSEFKAKLERVRELVNEFDILVNPFSNGKFSLNNLPEYIEKLDVWNMSDEACISFSTGRIKTEFYANKSEWHYICIFSNDEDDRYSENCLIVEHRGDKGGRTPGRLIERVKCFERKVGQYDKTLTGFKNEVEMDLRLGQVCDINKGSRKYRFATIEELDILIKNLKLCKNLINSEIISGCFGIAIQGE